MPTQMCPVKGFEHITVTWPDEWLMKHRDLFYLGKQQAGDDASPATREIFGTIAICEKIEGIDLSDFGNLTWDHQLFFYWLVQAVYVGGYLAALMDEAKKKARHSSGRLRRGQRNQHLSIPAGNGAQVRALG